MPARPRGAQSSGGGGGGGAGQRVEPLQQRLRAAAAHRDRGHHRHAELGRQAVEVDAEAAVAGDVEHVQRQQHRPADLAQLQHQPHGEAQVGGIGHAEQQVGPLLAGQAAEHHVAGDFLVGAAGAQRIGAGQVEQVHRRGRPG